MNSLARKQWTGSGSGTRGRSVRRGVARAAAVAALLVAAAPGVAQSPQAEPAVVRLICDAISLQPRFAHIQQNFAATVVPQRPGGKTTVVLDFSKDPSQSGLASMTRTADRYTWVHRFESRELRPMTAEQTHTVDRNTGRYVIRMTVAQDWDVSDSEWLTKKMGAPRGRETGYGEISGTCEKAPDGPRM